VTARFAAPRGTHDVLPSEQTLWDWVIHEFEELCRLYGYRRIHTPAFEDTELFVRTSGDSSDLVRKEMYTFEDRGGRSLTLRPEATAPIVRAYLQHGLQRRPQPQKLYAIETIYRYGRPQKGRFREHWQLDVEAIGSDDPAIDAEVIELYRALLLRLGVSDFTLGLNSIGDSTCRPAYIARLRQWIDEHDSELDAETREQARRNPLRALDNLAAKPAAVQAVLRGAPAIGDSLCEPCRLHFAEVRGFLDAYGVDYELEATLVRGLDYYTRTTWEFVGPDEGAQSTLSGGGRYDGLATELGGRHTPGVGFGAGLERLLDAVEASHSSQSPDRTGTEGRLDVYFALAEGAPRDRVVRWLRELREQGISSDTDYARRSLKGQLSHAARLAAGITVVVRADGASIRRPGRVDEDVSFDDLPRRLQP
jgi:histidyl-tRNA synthetase